MSTILKALRRVEEVRSTHVQRPLREEVAGTGSRPPPRTRGRQMRFAALALGVGGIAGVVAFWSVTQGTPPQGGAGPQAAAVLPAPGLPPAAPTADAESAAVAEMPPRLSPEPAGAPPSYVEPFAEPRELSPAALASPVERVDRPPAGPRIADPDAQEPPRHVAAPGAYPPRPVRRVPPDEMPGEHRPMARELPEPAEASVKVALTATSVPTPPVEAPEPSVGQTSGVPPIEEPLPEPSPAPSVASRPSTPEVAADSEKVSESAALQTSATPDGSEAPAGPATVRAAKAEPEGPAAPVAAPSEPDAAPEQPSSGQALARSDVPGVRVERTSWHPESERRSALVVVGDASGRREIHEGDVVGPLVVSTIKPSAVIFLHEGIEVVRRVGEH